MIIVEAVLLARLIIVIVVGLLFVPGVGIKKRESVVGVRTNE